MTITTLVRGSIEREDGSSLRAELANLTGGSVFVKSAVALPFGTLVTLRIEDVVLQGEVALVARDPQGLVVVFEVPRDQRMRFAALVESVEVLPEAPWVEHTVPGPGPEEDGAPLHDLAADLVGLGPLDVPHTDPSAASPWMPAAAGEGVGRAVPVLPRAAAAPVPPVAPSATRTPVSSASRTPAPSPALSVGAATPGSTAHGAAAGLLGDVATTPTISALSAPPPALSPPPLSAPPAVLSPPPASRTPRSEGLPPLPQLSARPAPARGASSAGGAPTRSPSAMGLPTPMPLSGLPVAASSSGLPAASSARPATSGVGLPSHPSSIGLRTPPPPPPSGIMASASVGGLPAASSGGLPAASGIMASASSGGLPAASSGGLPAPRSTSTARPPVAAPSPGPLPELGADDRLLFGSTTDYVAHYKSQIAFGGIIARAAPRALGSMHPLTIVVPGVPQPVAVRARVGFLGEGTVGLMIDSFPIEKPRLEELLAWATRGG